MEHTTGCRLLASTQHCKLPCSAKLDAATFANIVATHMGVSAHQQACFALTAQCK